MTAFDIMALTDAEFKMYFPGCCRWSELPKFKVGDVVIAKSHFGEERKVHVVTGHCPPSQIDPRGWTVYVNGIDVPGYNNGGWSCGWEGYWELLEVYELEKAFAAPVKRSRPSQHKSAVARLLRWILSFVE